MKVVLQEDLKGKGKKGDVITVSDGYAMNFLIPKKIAVNASSTIINEINQKKAADIARMKKEKEDALKGKDALSSATVRVKVKCGESGKIFGSVTSKEIATALNNMGFNVDKKNIILKEPIKKIGREMIEIKLYHDVIARVNIVVEAE
ncbi:MAG: 50S ribosomal protein L9 [Clostridia bacterium]|nr:50S ribosomal protein L9 [Clostridia bacterium]